MGLFKKKYPLKESLVLKEKWRLAKGTYQGNPLFIRINTGAKKLAGHPEYSHQVGIAVPLNNPNDHGFPQNEEFDQLNEVEDLISERLKMDNESLLVGILSTDGMREFVLYTSDPAAIKTKFAELSGLIRSHDLQLMIQLDEDWSVYKGF